MTRALVVSSEYQQSVVLPLVALEVECEAGGVSGWSEGDSACPGVAAEPGFLRPVVVTVKEGRNGQRDSKTILDREGSSPASGLYEQLQVLKSQSQSAPGCERAKERARGIRSKNSPKHSDCRNRGFRLC
uniref:Uncharacterized protein n=1 Tax=Knipowitschia caucasica TaxID=637954 RepID=A0AAV2JE90_KNICA